MTFDPPDFFPPECQKLFKSNHENDANSIDQKNVYIPIDNCPFRMISGADDLTSFVMGQKAFVGQFLFDTYAFA